jgi:hypothetical protein
LVVVVDFGEYFFLVFLMDSSICQIIIKMVEKDPTKTGIFRKPFLKSASISLTFRTIQAA